MSNRPPTDLQALWQGQPVEPTRLSPEEIRAKATRFQRTIRFRNLREYVAAGVVVVVFAGYASGAQTWLGKLGPALVALGTLFVTFQLYTRAGAKPLPGEEGTTESCVRFHRAELERQRDMLRTVSRWYLAPLVPGLVLMFVDRFVQAAAKGGVAVAVAAGAVVLTTLVFAGIAWLNAVAAKKLDREIAALGDEP